MDVGNGFSLSGDLDKLKEQLSEAGWTPLVEHGLHVSDFVLAHYQRGEERAFVAKMDDVYALVPYRKEDVSSDGQFPLCGECGNHHPPDPRKHGAPREPRRVENMMNMASGMEMKKVNDPACREDLDMWYHGSPNNEMILVRPTCHSAAGLDVAYRGEGMLELFCQECRGPVLRVAVGQRESVFNREEEVN